MISLMFLGKICFNILLKWIQNMKINLNCLFSSLNVKNWFISDCRNDLSFRLCKLVLNILHVWRFLSNSCTTNYHMEAATERLKIRWGRHMWHFVRLTDDNHKNWGKNLELFDCVTKEKCWPANARFYSF